jgi:hypothetical protein
MIKVTQSIDKVQLQKFFNVMGEKAVTQKGLTLLPILLMSFIPSVVQASCLIWTSWQPTRLTQQQCLNRAELAMRNSGFSQNFYTLETGVYGENGGYSGTVRCISSKGVVFFIVAGSSSKTAESFLGRLENNF